jgi:5S rRNA maturation endonuclease (ribonuclease M5)
MNVQTVKDALDYAAFYASELTGLKNGQGDEAIAFCPFHNDQHTPNLSINLKSGLFKCFACGAQGDVLSFYQKRHGCDFKEALIDLARIAGVNGGHPQAQKPQVVATYDYLDNSGNRPYQVCRREPGANGKKKDFHPRRPDGNGGWIWGLAAGKYGRREGQKDWYRIKEGQSYAETKNFPTCRPILYRLPDVLQADAVCVVEGEKCADSLANLGVTTTCNPGGAGKWRSEFDQTFLGKKVVVFSDNDDPGRAHAQNVARNLHGVAAKVKVVELPSLPEKGDVSDWLKAGGTIEQLKVLMEAAPEWKPEPEDDHLAKLNERHAVVMIGGKCIVMNEVIDPVFNRPDITFSSVFDFKNYYSNIKTSVIRDGKPKVESVGKVWLESPERRQYAGIVFAPGQDIPGFYNLFRGFAVKPQKGDWSLMRNHIREIIADGNEEYFQYLLAWMSRLVQDPGGERAGVSIALRGEMGTGKGCFASQFGEIFGTHFLHITNPVHLVHRFNSHLKDCLLCFVDEGIWAGDKTAEGVLKGMITEKHIVCEPKGKDAFLVKNHIHLIIASNSEWIVPAGFDERRFLVLDVSNKRKQDHEYFGAIFGQMDHGGREAMLYDLLEMKSDVDLRKVPRTGALLDQVICTMPTAHKFWLERLRAGTLLDEHREWEPYVITEKLYQAYLDFAANCGDRYRLIDRQFGREIRKLCPEAKRGQKVIDSRDRWVLYFPELVTCRNFFENAVRTKVNWDAEINESDLPF